MLSLSKITIGAIVSFVFIACGENKTAKIPKTKKNQYDAMDSSNQTTADPNLCTGSTEDTCRKVQLSLKGASAIGGSVGRTAAWNISGEAPGQRVVKVMMIGTLQDAQLTEQDGGKSVNIMWNPTESAQGTFEMRVRDMTRCMRIVSSGCDKLEMENDRVDQVVKVPYEILPAGQLFNTDNSNFFQQFKCDSAGYSRDQAKAITGGAEVLVDTVGGKETDGRAEKVANVFDVLFKGEPEPTAKECLDRQRKANSTQGK